MNFIDDPKRFAKGWICKTCLVQIDGKEKEKLNEHQGHMIEEDNLSPEQIIKFVNARIENKKSGISFAHNPKILEDIQKDLDKAHVGDNKNKVLAMILLASSKRNGHEQAIIIQKQSSAGGSNLQNTCLAYFDDKITLTRMTGAYLDRSGVDYTGKILAIGELSGFDSASSSLRQKLSESKTSLATTDKDDKGKIITNILTTEGRPSFITTTTSEDIHQELENRCWILSIDETSNQTKAVNKHQFSKDTLEYEEWAPKPEIKALFNSETLKDLRVLNPFAVLLGESFPSDSVTARRDSKRFAELITTITYIHQHQRVKIKFKNHTFLLASYEDLQHALYYGQDALKNTLNKLNEKDEAVIAYMKSSFDKQSFNRGELCSALSIPYATMKRILTKLVDRSFLEMFEDNRVWVYKLSNKVMIDGIELGSDESFKEAALHYLATNAPKFEEIIIPPNYESMKGVDGSIMDSLLSFNGTVTTESDNTLGVDSVPVTTLPPVNTIDTDSTQMHIPVTITQEDKKG